uniref:SRCR domain-containing protein n=1 Tax=Xiphophorus maculatus TaxID=8083 RepID=A0A3B5R5L0_XIPMA
ACSISRYSVRVVQGTNRCSGRLEVKTNQSWSSVCEKDFDLQDAEVVCREISCGPPSVHQGALYGEAEAPVGSREFLCEGSESALLNCSSRKSSGRNSCSPDSVRLVQGTDRCSGRLEVKTDQSWSSVCEKDFDLQDAEVVCREIGCGPPSVHQGALYGEAEAPVGSREFLCEGSESALLNCSSRKSSGRNSCSPGQAVGLTCSDQDNIRLVGEASRCAGRLEMLQQEEWRPVDVSSSYWNMNSVAAVCAGLDCGSAVSARNSKEASERPVWRIWSHCFLSGSALKNCLPYGENSDQSLELICSGNSELSYLFLLKCFFHQVPDVCRETERETKSVLKWLDFEADMGVDYVVLDQLDPRAKPKVVHYNHLKPYRSPVARTSVTDAPPCTGPPRPPELPSQVLGLGHLSIVLWGHLTWHMLLNLEVKVRAVFQLQ